MPCARQSHQNQAAANSDSTQLPDLATNDFTASAASYPAPQPASHPYAVPSAQQLMITGSDRSPAAELPSEGILRSYAASQQMQAQRHQSLSHQAVQPFMQNVMLDQALLTYVPYVPITTRKQAGGATGTAASAA